MKQFYERKTCIFYVFRRVGVAGLICFLFSASLSSSVILSLQLLFMDVLYLFFVVLRVDAGVFCCCCLFSSRNKYLLHSQRKWLVSSTCDYLTQNHTVHSSIKENKDVHDSSFSLCRRSQLSMSVSSTFLWAQCIHSNDLESPF